MSNYKFDVKKTTEEVIAWIQNFFIHNGKDCNAIVGISGGKDSSVVAALCVKALGRDRVIGVMMPNGRQTDIDYSKELIEYLGIKSIEVNISSAVNGVLNEVRAGLIDGLGGGNSIVNISEQTIINLPARIRMAVLYAVSQSNNGRVANTCNLSEDWVGYATRYGDAAGDFSPLSKLTTDEVIAIGDYLELPYKLTHKTPTDGLCGKTDEDNLGFTYEILNKYIRTGVIEDETIKEKIDEMHQKNLFKLELMPSFNPNYTVAI